jgi:hypothetical protein
MTEACRVSCLGHKLGDVAHSMGRDEWEVDQRRNVNQLHRTKIAGRAGDVTPLTLGGERMPEGGAVLMYVPRA